MLKKGVVTCLLDFDQIGKFNDLVDFGKGLSFRVAEFLSMYLHLYLPLKKYFLRVKRLHFFLNLLYLSCKKCRPDCICLVFPKKAQTWQY